MNLTEKFRHTLHRAELLVAGQKLTLEQRIEMEKDIENLQSILDMCMVGEDWDKFVEGEVGC